MAKQFLNPPALGTVAGPFSQGVRSGNTIWVSAQSATDGGGHLVSKGDALSQCRAIFKRIGEILAAGGAQPSDVVMVRGFLKDRSVLEATWQARREFFGDHRPASTSLMVSDIEAEGALMSFEIVAMLD